MRDILASPRPGKFKELLWRFAVSLVVALVVYLLSVELVYSIVIFATTVILVFLGIVFYDKTITPRIVPTVGKYEFTEYMNDLLDRHVGNIIAMSKTSIFALAGTQHDRRLTQTLAKVKDGSIREIRYVIFPYRFAALVRTGKRSVREYKQRLEPFLKHIIDFNPLPPERVMIVVSPEEMFTGFQLFYDSDITKGTLIIYFEQPDGNWESSLNIQRSPQILRYYHEYFEYTFQTSKGWLLDNYPVDYKIKNGTITSDSHRLRMSLKLFVENELSRIDKQ